MNADYWPSYLFKARVVALSKNDKAYPTARNTRTISVLPAIAKLMERIILSRIEGRLFGETNALGIKTEGTIHSSQFGFRPEKGTLDQLARYVAMGQKALARETSRRNQNVKVDNNNRTFVCMLDLSQAFDR